MHCLWWIKQQWKGNPIRFFGGRSFKSRSKMQETRLKPLGSFFFLLAKAQRPVCGRQAQRNLTVNSSIFSRLLVLVSRFLALFSWSFLLYARKGAESQRNLTANSSIFSRLLVLGSCLLLLSSFCAQRRRDLSAAGRRKEI